MATSPNPKFDTGVLVPVPNSRGEQCWDSIRIPVPFAPVQIAPAGNALANAATFQPIVAIQVQPRQCAFFVDPCGTPYQMYADDTICRASIYLNVIRPLGAVVQAVPNPFDFQVRMASSMISESIIQGTVTPSSYADNGLIVSFNGLLGNQIELWGRIQNKGGAQPAALPYEIGVQFLVDRYQQLGSGDPASNAFPVDVFSGRMVTSAKVQFYP